MVTGAANGIGQSIVEALHSHGAVVAALDIADNLDATAIEIASSGPPVHPVRIDLSDRSDLRRGFGAALEILGGLDILVNAAGILRREPSRDHTLEAWDLTLEINLTAVFEMCQFAGRVMLEQGSGKIVNIGSYNSIAGTEALPAYCASKGGVKLLTMTLAAEWGPGGVHVNAIAPGYVETALSSDLRQDPEGYQETLPTIPLGRWATVDDLKGPVLFLASAASDYVTGISLVVDGGRLAK
jgi:2-deoxy-D-gluconate 3-dehydrogenase